MLAHYFRVAFRNLLRHKGYSFINITGLAVGLAGCILMLLFVQDEISYDRFHEHADRIYRVVVDFKDGNNIDRFAHTQAPLAPALVEEFPEVIDAVRMTSYRELVGYGPKQFWEDGFVLADPSIFSVFTFPLVKGDPKTAIKDPYTAVITQSAARKYFGEEDPVGKVLRIGVERPIEFKITGILKDIPSNSQLQFDFLASFSHQRGNLGWMSWNYTTYILLPKNYPAGELEKKIPSFLERHLNEKAREDVVFHLQPLTSIHLTSGLRSDLNTNRSVTDIYSSCGIALIILILACINFINLATARSTLREREVGVRKVVGATRWQLIQQFLGESIVLSFLALLVAILLVEASLPVFNHLADKHLHLDLLWNPIMLVGSLITAFVVGILAGSYPAFVVSAYQPHKVISGLSFLNFPGRPSFLRRTLVVAQFAVSIGFLCCLAIVYHQLLYVRGKNLGFQKNNIVTLPIFFKDVQPRSGLFKQEILTNTDIISATATSFSPDNGYNQTAWWEGMSEEDYSQMIRWISADEDFIKTLGLEIVGGRDFSKGPSDELHRSYVLNESAVQKIGWANPVGKSFKIVEKGTVVGVVKDFHFRSLHHTIEPIALNNYPGAFNYLLVRVQPGRLASSIRFLQEKWTQLFPGCPFSYSFLEDDLWQEYRSEARLESVLNYTGGLSILIACLGLLGLASHTAERKTKEIGIRKVLGATVAGVVTLLSKDLVKPVLLANLLAWPPAYWVMDRWLQDFAYRVDISWWEFPLAGALALVISLLAVSTQAVGAAVANPVDALRYE